MRFLLLIVFGFSLQAFAEEAVSLEEYRNVEVTFNNGKTSNCQLVNRSHVYKCPDGKSTIFIGLKNYLSAIVVDENSKVSQIEVAKVTKDKTTIYQAAKIPNYPHYPNAQSNSGNQQDQNNIHLVEDKKYDLIILESFLGHFPEEINQSSQLSDIKKSLDTIHDKMKVDLSSLTESKNYIIELDDGSSKSCQRLEAKKEICDIYSCQNISPEGSLKGETSLLFYKSSNPKESFYPTLQNFSNNVLQAAPFIKKIIEPTSKKVIASYDPRYLADNANQARMLLDHSLKQDADNILFLKSEWSDHFYKQQSENCAVNPAIVNYDKARENLKEKIAYSDLAEMISVLQDGALTSQFLSQETAQAHGCYYGGVYFDKLAAQNINKIVDTFPKQLSATQVISKAKVNELFNKAIAMKDIAWNYKYDGCYARAHLMARRFEAEGIRVDKAWIKGNLYVPGSDITWNYHVAPLVYVEDENGKIQKMVIDPSLFDRPVTLEEWDNKIAKKTKRGSVETVFPFPQNADFYERSALAVSSSDPYTPYENIDNSEEDKMQHAQNIMAQYLSDDGQNPY